MNYRDMFASFRIGQRVHIKPPSKTMKNTREVGATVTGISMKFRGIPTHEQIMVKFEFDEFPFTDSPWTPWGLDDGIRLSHNTDWKIREDKCSPENRHKKKPPPTRAGRGI